LLSQQAALTPNHPLKVEADEGSLEILPAAARFMLNRPAPSV